MYILSFYHVFPFELVGNVLDGRHRNPPGGAPDAAVDGVRLEDEDRGAMGGRCF